LREIFGRMGCTDREIVALSGAHAVGRCRKERSGYEGAWTDDPQAFDNSYFKKLIEVHRTGKAAEGQLMLPSDLTLMDDPIFAAHVRVYAEYEDIFRADFASAFSKLQEFGMQDASSRPNSRPTSRPQSATSRPPQPPAGPKPETARPASRCPMDNTPVKKPSEREANTPSTTVTEASVAPVVQAVAPAAPTRDPLGDFFRARMHLNPNSFLPALFRAGSDSEPTCDLPDILAEVARHCCMDRMLEDKKSQEWVSKFSGTIQQCMKSLGDVELALEDSTFLCGERVTLADFVVLPHLITCDSIGELDKSPNTKRYMAMFQKHAAWAKCS